MKTSVSILNQSGVYRLSSILVVVVTLSLFSCEIEDDFGKPDYSSNYGSVLYNSPYDEVYKIVWSEQTNQIVALGNSITVIDIDTKISRQLNVYNIMYISDLTWVNGQTLYYLDYNSNFSSVNISSGLQQLSMADSIVQYYDGLPFSSRYLAFNKLDKYDPANEPYLYFLDLETRNEVLITSGSPITFSPDSKNLLFSRRDPYTYARLFYSYSLDTKAISLLPIQEPYVYSGPIKWTSSGILFFYVGNYGDSEVFNATTNKKIGTWKNLLAPSHNTISPSGTKIITCREKCATGSSLSYCYSFTKQYFQVVDLTNATEKETVYGQNLYSPLFAFSPDEKSIAFSTANSIYLIQSPD